MCTLNVYLKVSRKSVQPVTFLSLKLLNSIYLLHCAHTYECQCACYYVHSKVQRTSCESRFSASIRQVLGNPI